MMGDVEFTRSGMVAGMEVGGKPVGPLVAQAVTEASLDLSTSMTSQLELTLADPAREFLSSGSFAKGTVITWGGLDLVVAVRGTVDVGGGPGLAVTARARGVQSMKRRRGAKVWRGQSYATWLRSECRAVGLRFYGESTPKLAQVVRGKDETSWDVATRAAREVGFLLFEAAGAVYFARPTWLVAHLPKQTITWGSTQHLLAFPTIRDSDDDGTVGLSGSLSVDYTHADDFLPGRGVALHGMGAYSHTYMATSLRMTLDGISPGDVGIATPINPAPEPPDTSAESSGRRSSSARSPSASYRGRSASGRTQAERFVSWALEQAGDRYIYGAEASLNDPNPRAFDCSELVQWAAHRAGGYMPDGSSAQRAYCKRKGTLISIAKARGTRGALLFGNGHVAISLGDGGTIEAANSRLGVRKLNSAGRPWIAGGLVPGMGY